MTHGAERDVEQELDALAHALDSLALHMNEMKLRLRYYASDLAFYGYGNIVYESGQGVRTLLAYDLPGAAYPVARAALEAAQDTQLLMAWPNYGEAGARAYAFGQLELFQLRRAFIELGNWSDIPPPHSYEDVRKSIAVTAADWNRRAKGSGDQLLGAYDHFEPLFQKAERKGPHPRHWSQLSRRKIAAMIQENGKGDPSYSAQMVTIYSFLSRASHPGVRQEQWVRKTRPDGRTGIHMSGRNSAAAVTGVTVAVKIMAQAFADFEMDREKQEDAFE